MPANEHLTIAASSESPILHVVVRNQLGVVRHAFITTTDISTFNISFLENGIYHIELETKEGISNRTFVKN